MHQLYVHSFSKEGVSRFNPSDELITSKHQYEGGGG